MKNNLHKYCKTKKISIEDLSKIVGLNTRYLYDIANNSNKNITLETINKIYEGTKKEFGEGLSVWEYLDVKKGLTKK